MVLSALFVSCENNFESMFFVIKVIRIAITIEEGHVNLGEPRYRWVESFDDIRIVFKVDVRYLIGEDRKGLVMWLRVAFVVIELIDTHDDIVVM